MARWGWLHIAVALAHTRPDDVISLPFSAPKSSSYRRNGSNTGLRVYAATYGQRHWRLPSLPCAGAASEASESQPPSPALVPRTKQRCHSTIGEHFQRQSSGSPTLCLYSLPCYWATYTYACGLSSRCPLRSGTRWLVQGRNRLPLGNPRRICGKTGGCSAAYFGIFRFDGVRAARESVAHSEPSLLPRYIVHVRTVADMQPDGHTRSE